ncbi:metal ABC transporter substrate-binding protein [Bacillus sp. AFS055030]|uniref:metal ABC transporter substrate-binding protein n=1 Tax=Bacillus sp. AFS055030 TaxID=2033507 RepID=UPI000BFCB60C|nr:metal ABC transporter substrate-binding protein [Bacillus sp. AFS055030]PGL69912.1 adhesin [Bacillus sp. AFS055030]
MKFKKLAITTLLLTSAVLSACNKETQMQSTKNKNKLTIYTTIYPLQDFTEKIGGKYVDVHSIYPTGVDTHDFEPTSKQIVKIANSDLFVYNGAGMEPFADKISDTLKNNNVSILEATKNIELIKSNEEEIEADEDHNDVDPHVWLDPSRAKIEAQNIKDELIKLMPKNKQYFEANYQQIESQFDELDRELRNLVLHSERKDIVVSHAAYGYLEEHYGIEQIPITGLSPSQEPSQKDLKKVVDFVKQHHVKYILFESFATPKVASVVKNETHAKILRLSHLATISEDDLKKHKDYFDLMQENINTLDKTLNNR